MATWTTFEDIEAYKLARELRKEISRFCKTLPKEETYRLKDQIVRSSRSVTANIAEGFGRHHHQENAQFCRHARGSLSETLDHLNCALDEEYLSHEEYVRLRGALEQDWKVLNGYIAYLQRCANEGVPSGKRRVAKLSGCQVARLPSDSSCSNSATQQPNNLATGCATQQPSNSAT